MWGRLRRRCRAGLNENVPPKPSKFVRVIPWKQMEAQMSRLQPGFSLRGTSVPLPRRAGTCGRQASAVLLYHIAFYLPRAAGEMVVAEALDFPGAVTQGFDLSDARLMIASAMEDLPRKYSLNCPEMLG